MTLPLKTRLLRWVEKLIGLRYNNNNNNIVKIYVLIFSLFFSLFQMDRLNAVGRLEIERARPLNQLVVNQLYKIRKMRFVSTRFGPRVLIFLENFGCSFLSCRIHQFLDSNPELKQQMLDQIANGRLGMRYLGGQFNGIEFEEI